ncbi:hypothetical protein CVT25_015230 [Psilocybe cyanescens]|uniref:EH domain-containing protein n=1 Tax=Psilocybe cyanescens TaxID=93625 RepID=A0A409XQZ6_PSICY|nr:hypothetical protein CVT25_015230 [Psilocybe cyanescens]
MPATSSVQTRISAFESLSRPSPSPSPPNLGRKTSLLDLKDWIVDDGPASKTPTAPVYPPLISLQSPSPRPIPKPKPPSLTVDHSHRYPPLSLTLDSPRNSTPGHAPSSSISSFHSVSLSSDTDPSTPGSVAGFIATFPMDDDYRQHTDSDSVSLSESYEQVSTSSLASPATERLISLDWEKALAKRGPVPPKLPQRPPSTRSSFKPTPPPSHPVSRAASVSGSTPTSPILRPAISAAASSSSLALAAATINTPYTPRRPAPPPPPSRSSDRSSIRSIATTNSYSSSSYSHSHSQPQPQPPRSVHHTPSLLSLKTKRPTPVPLAARKRYEAVFANNVVQRRRAEKRRSDDEKPALLSPTEARGRRAVGWRGLSIDLITADELAQSPTSDHSVDERIGPDENLEGPIVRFIWKRSGLSNAQLSDIWNECDITGKGALSLEAFVKGMWRIDEELRRAQTQAIKSATNGAAAYRSNSLRSAHKPPHRPRDILR